MTECHGGREGFFATSPLTNTYLHVGMSILSLLLSLIVALCTISGFLPRTDFDPSL